MTTFETTRPESTERIRRWLMGIGGVAAIVLDSLWFGAPTPWYINWSDPTMRTTGALIWALGLAGVLAPMLRRSLSEQDRALLYGGCLAGLVVAAIWYFGCDSADRPYLGEYTDTVLQFGCVSFAGGLCALLTAIWPRCGWRRWLRRFCERFGLTGRVAIIGPRYRD